VKEFERFLERFLEFTLINNTWSLADPRWGFQGVLTPPFEIHFFFFKISAGASMRLVFYDFFGSLSLAKLQ
jgi:hypothetical protein